MLAADYPKHLTDNLLSFYPPEQYHFAVQEKFWNLPQEAYDSVHKFLGVSKRPVERKIINSKVEGADQYPLVDYRHADYRPALEKVILYFQQRNAILFDMLGWGIPEWRQYDELYAELLNE